jgi:hypothetical protein
MAGTKTGTGGFELDGEIRTYDVGSPDSEPIVAPVDHGDINVDKTPKDLSKPTRILLGQYLRDVSLGDRGDNRGNRFPITGEPTEVSTKTSQGYPAALAPPSEDQFATELQPSTTSDFIKVSRDVNKGANAKTGVDGHDLLRERGTSIVRRYTSEVLSKNRFSVDNKSHADVNLDYPEKDYNPDVRMPTKLGKYDSGDIKTSNDIIVIILYFI